MTYSGSQWRRRPYLIRNVFLQKIINTITERNFLSPSNPGPPIRRVQQRYEGIEKELDGARKQARELESENSRLKIRRSEKRSSSMSPPRALIRRGKEA